MGVAAFTCTDLGWAWIRGSMAIHEEGWRRLERR
jgi:hypothetical protein